MFFSIWGKSKKDNLQVGSWRYGTTGETWESTWSHAYSISLGNSGCTRKENNNFPLTFANFALTPLSLVILVEILGLTFICVTWIHFHLWTDYCKLLLDFSYPSLNLRVGVSPYLYGLGIGEENWGGVSIWRERNVGQLKTLNVPLSVPKDA